MNSLNSFGEDNALLSLAVLNIMLLYWQETLATSKTLRNQPIFRSRMLLLITLGVFKLPYHYAFLSLEILSFQQTYVIRCQKHC